MCFRIDKTAPAWRLTTVYKVLSRTGIWQGARWVPSKPPKWVSQLYSDTRWRVGETKGLRRGPFVTDDGTKAKRGIYVYRTLKRAKKEVTNSAWRTVVALQVDPKDFLHQDLTRTVATYRRVKLIRVVS